MLYTRPQQLPTLVVRSRAPAVQHTGTGQENNQGASAWLQVNHQLVTCGGVLGKEASFLEQS